MTIVQCSDAFPLELRVKRAKVGEEGVRLAVLLDQSPCPIVMVRLGRLVLNRKGRGVHLVVG